MARSQPVRRARMGLPLKDHDPSVTPLAPLFDESIEKKRRKISPATEKNYRCSFDLFCRWLDLVGLPRTVSSFAVEQLEAYADYLAGRPALAGKRGFDGATLSNYSQESYLRPLRSFSIWLAWHGWVPESPFHLTFESIMPSLERSKRILRLATPSDVRALLEATHGDDPLSLRGRAILLVAWESGLRTQDIVRLDIDRVNLRTGILTILDSKGDNDREGKLGATALQALAAYLGTGRPAQLAAAPDRRYRTSEALFLSGAVGSARNRTGRLTENGVYEIFSRRARQAGVAKHFGAHRFRHGLATLLVEANVSLALIADWLGQSLETTTKLYAHPTANAIHRVVGPVVAASLDEPVEGRDKEAA
jgi:integrase/recombinase XerD